MTASPAPPRPARRHSARALIDTSVAALTARLEARVANAARRAGATGRAVLVSVVVAVPAVDPLDALDGAAAAGGEVRAALRAGRMYWTRRTDDFALAGIGAAATVAPAGPGRFAAAESAWKELLDGAVIDDASDGAVGTGPLLLGGFAFDPAGARAAHWRGFPGARLVLPQLQLTAAGGAHWLTANVRVGADGTPDAQPAHLGRLARALLTGRPSDTVSAADDERADGAHADGERPHAGVRRADVLDGAEWRGLAGEAAAAVRAGALDKVVLARAVRLTSPRAFDVTAALRRLRARYPDCYVFGCWGADDGAAFVGASPERLVRLDGRLVRATSLAGSAPRGDTPEEDAAHAAALLASPKERREHAVVRDWLVDALGGLCDGVRAAAAPAVRALPNLFHLHTDVRARLCPGRTLFDLAARLHPTPAVGGAPRGTALAFLSEREHLDRGWYAAPVGWVGRAGGEFAVALRSALVRGADAWLFAGCGIVADSDPAREYAESLLKLRPMEQALGATSPAADVRSASGAMPG